MYYNERLLFLRESKELTQEEISNAIGIKRQQYRRYEAGINLLPITHLKTLCEVYGVSADYILGLPEDLKYPKR